MVALAVGAADVHARPAAGRLPHALQYRDVLESVGSVGHVHRSSSGWGRAAAALSGRPALTRAIFVFAFQRVALAAREVTWKRPGPTASSLPSSVSAMSTSLSFATDAEADHRRRGRLDDGDAAARDRRAREFVDLADQRAQIGW